MKKRFIVLVFLVGAFHTKTFCMKKFSNNKGFKKQEKFVQMVVKGENDNVFEFLKENKNFVITDKMFKKQEDLKAFYTQKTFFPYYDHTDMKDIIFLKRVEKNLIEDFLKESPSIKSIVNLFDEGRYDDDKSLNLKDVLNKCLDKSSSPKKVNKELFLQMKILEFYAQKDYCRRTVCESILGSEEYKLFMLWDNRELNSFVFFENVKLLMQHKYFQSFLKKTRPYISFFDKNVVFYAYNSFSNEKMQQLKKLAKKVLPSAKECERLCLSALANNYISKNKCSMIDPEPFRWAQEKKINFLPLIYFLRMTSSSKACLYENEKFEEFKKKRFWFKGKLKTLFCPVKQIKDIKNLRWKLHTSKNCNHKSYFHLWCENGLSFNGVAKCDLDLLLDRHDSEVKNILNTFIKKYNKKYSREHFHKLYDVVVTTDL
ncbi:hypothetical protein KAH94_02090 [bacterium]|nr:hypothetical protein [bacterium]